MRYIVKHKKDLYPSEEFVSRREMLEECANWIAGFERSRMSIKDYGKTEFMEYALPHATEDDFDPWFDDCFEDLMNDCGWSVEEIK